MGPRPRCDDLGPPLYRGGAPRGLSGLCHPGGLEGPGGHGQTCLTPGVGAPAAPGAPGAPSGLDGHGAGGPGLGRSLAVAAYAPAGGAPVLASQHGGGTFRPTGQGRGVPLKTLVPEPGTPWQGTGIACTGRPRQLPWTLLACWEAGEKEPGLLLTALPPAASTACWYGLRAWMEQGCKLTKRAGWQWQRTHMTQPDRAARLWLAVAVATLGRLSVGGEADATVPASTVLDVTALVPQLPRTREATRRRVVRVFRRGWNLLLVAGLDHAPLPLGRFVPEPWPAVPVPEEAPTVWPALALPQAA
jgi:hypothetical protein